MMAGGIWVCFQRWDLYYRTTFNLSVMPNTCTQTQVGRTRLKCYRAFRMIHLDGQRLRSRSVV